MGHGLRSHPNAILTPHTAFYSEQSLRDSGFAHALLWVLDGNERAERFYRAAGWERDGEKEDVFQGATVTELRYRKQL